MKCDKCGMTQGLFEDNRYEHVPGCSVSESVTERVELKRRLLGMSAESQREILRRLHEQETKSGKNADL